MVLSKAVRGQKKTIISLRTTRALEERLAMLGIFPGAEVEVIRSASNGEMIIGCLDSRFALGGELTNVIEVA